MTSFCFLQPPLGTPKRFRIYWGGSNCWTLRSRILFGLGPTWLRSDGWPRIMVELPYHLCLRFTFLPVSFVLTNYGYCTRVGLGENMLMSSPPDGEMEASEPGKGKKRKAKAAADPSMAKKPKSLEHRAVTRTSTSTSRASPGAEDEDDDDDNECRLAQRTRSRAGASQVPRPEAAESRTTGSGFQFSSGELRDAQDVNAAKVGGPFKGEARLDIFLTMLAGTSILTLLALSRQRRGSCSSVRRCMIIPFPGLTRSFHAAKRSLRGCP
uniref:Uncharacterized protein LOC104212443 isoform X1 n=1 Tax=Nicotiana sylvestris TaxID=4096 RepID=A0A1U7V0T7_NICSY|nr:PREDICTED: uncharacterized protein LOC104212443 isoform X1 [Nicotiana sylvestris]